DAGVLLDSALVGRLDARVRERFLAETHGNPLALLELPQTLTPAEATRGILRRPDGSLSGRIEDSFRRRLEPLPEDTRRLLVAAAEAPLGDPLLLLRAHRISASLSRLPMPPRMPGFWRSGSAPRSAIRLFALRSTERRRRPNGGGRTRRSPRRPIRNSTRI